MTIKKVIGRIGVVLAIMLSSEASAVLYPQYPLVDYGKGEEAAVVQRGEYLAKAGDCLACHTDTQNGGKAFAGGLAINTPFGTFYTPNITFDKGTGIAGWTEEDFAKAMREGKRPSGDFYFPVFPYIYFSKITDEDIHALYEYMKRVPTIHRENTPLPFPFNVPGARYSLIGWDLLFFYPTQAPFEYDFSQTEEWNRGAYLVQGLGHCSMCHTPLNPLGAPKNDYYLTGGFVDGYWAPNITKYGLEGADPQEIARVFSKDELIHQAGNVEGPMAEVNHDSLRYLTNEDHVAMAVYLKTVVSEEPMTPAPRDKGQSSLGRGEQVYRTACITCHQKGEVGAPLLGASGNWYLRMKDRGLDTLYRHAVDGFNSMPPKGACVLCSNNDVKDAVDYLLHESLKPAQWDSLKHQKPLSELDGKVVYTKNCAVCHSSGLNGAPKIGDKSAWAPLINANLDELMANTMNGPTHPKNGGCKECSSKETIAALKYMVNQSQDKGNYSLW